MLLTQIRRAARKLAAGRPAHELQRELEARNGYQVVLPGTVPWFPLDDWAPNCVVARDGRNIRLTIIDAVRPGAFRRLLQALANAGLNAQVICPVSQEMLSILVHYNFQPHYQIEKHGEQIDVWELPALSVLRVKA